MTAPSTLDAKVSKYQQYPVDLLDALKTLKYPPVKQLRPKTRTEDKLHPTGGRVELSVPDSPQSTFKKTNDDFPLSRSKRKPNAVPPLGGTRARKIRDPIGLDLIPKLRKLDYETEKEREIQRVMNNLKLNKNFSHRTATTSSKNKESYGTTSTGLDVTSSLIEGHNLTLKQLREFWSEMPSFLNIQAASLKNKYGIFENGGTDIDDISIEIVKKCNQPGATFLPHISKSTPRILQCIDEEQVQ